MVEVIDWWEHCLKLWKSLTQILEQPKKEIENFHKIRTKKMAFFKDVAKRELRKIKRLKAWKLDLSARKYLKNVVLQNVNRKDAEFYEH